MSRILVLVVAIASLTTLAACGKREPCLATLPTTLPEGVESVVCSASCVVDGQSKPGTVYEGSYDISIKLKKGYEESTLVLTIDGEDASKHSAFKEKVVGEGTIDYKFEKIKKSLAFELSGAPKLIDYQVSLKIEDSDESTLFDQVNFEYSLISGTTENKSDSFTGESFKTHIGTAKVLTMHYGDIIKIKAKHKDAFGAVFSDILITEALNQEEYLVSETGHITTIASVNISGSVEIKISESAFETASQYLETSLILDEQMAKISPVVMNGTEIFKSGSPKVSDLQEAEQFNLAINLTGTGIYSDILSNYENELLTFYVNGKEIEKSNIVIQESTFVIKNQARAYEYVDSQGETDFCPGAYTVKVEGVEEYIKSKSTQFVKIKIDTSAKSDAIDCDLDTYNYNNYIKNSDVIIDVNMLKTTEFSIIATNKIGETITIANVHTIENASPQSGVQVEKSISGEQSTWKITFDESLNIQKIEIK